MTHARSAPVRVSGTEDGWLLAAAALRHAALDGPGVDALSRSARFQTRGRGPAVFGVTLMSQPDGAIQADVGLLLTAEVMMTDRLAVTLRAVEQRMRAAWAHFADAPALTIQLHVVDVVMASSDAL